MGSYKYKNMLSVCPNCGAELSEKDEHCPFCNITLVGFNEEYNRIQNLNESADKINDISKKREKLNQQMNIENNKKKKALAIRFYILAILVFGFIATIVVTENIDEIKSIGKTFEYQSYREVEKSFKDSNFDFKLNLNVPNGQFGEEKRKGKDGDNAYKLFYNEETNETTISHLYIDKYNKKQYTISNTYKSDIMFMPEIDISMNSINYRSTHSPIYMDSEFDSPYEDMSIDEYVLDNFVYGKNNLIHKTGIVKQGSLDFWIYQKQSSYGTYYVIGVVKLSDEIMYIHKWSTDSKENFDLILENIDDYFNFMYVEEAYNG